MILLCISIYYAVLIFDPRRPSDADCSFFMPSTLYICYKRSLASLLSLFCHSDCVHHEKVGGNITSPLFPGNYPAGVRCKWVLEAPVNHTVKLFLEEFHLEQDKKCFYDFMEFFDGNTTEEEHRIGNRMCGNHGPRTFQSTGQKLSIVFNSDKSVTFKGFRAEWQTKEISKTT